MKDEKSSMEKVSQWGPTTRAGRAEARRKRQIRDAQRRRRRRQGVEPRTRGQGVKAHGSAKGVSEAARAAFEEALNGPSAGTRFVPGVYYERPMWLRAFDRNRVVLDENGVGWLPLNPEFVDPTREDLKFISLGGDGKV